MAITAKEVRAAASSVAGARGMGIETDASRAAPELLVRAEAALRAISGRADEQAETSLVTQLLPRFRPPAASEKWRSSVTPDGFRQCSCSNRAV